MTMEEKNQYIEQYINNISLQVNNQYGKELIDKDKIDRALTLFKDSSDDLETEIIPKINQLAQQIIDDFIEFQRQLEEMMRKRQEEQLSELATLELNTEKDGIYLSQQQVDLLMITELNSKEELQNYVENICGQFPNMSVEDIISNFDSITSTEQLEDAKKELYDKYLNGEQNGLISYLDNATMTDRQKAEVKLKRLGINGEELEKCLKDIEDGKINETFNYLGKKYGDEFITKFNRSMNDDFENVKGVSYDEMKSLSELITSDKSMDTIIIATGKFDNSIYPTLNGKVFDPYLTSKALSYCASHDKHMRYHALFDQSHVENLLKQGKGLQDHDQILAEMKAYVKISMEYIEKNNRPLSDGSKLISTVEIFNELVEKNKSDKNSQYAMVWEKYFGITTEEIVSCFDGIKKPDGVEFMYNETTLTESPQKRAMVEKVLFQIEQRNPNLIDSFGDQMHLSDKDVMTKKGIQNLTETAQMIKRIQDGKIMVDGQIQEIKPKKTECTEHDFHFTKPFLENINRMKEKGKNVNLWNTKRIMQSIASNTYVQNGVNFVRSTYWSLLGQNDHNVVRENIKIQKENVERKKKGLTEKPLVRTMSAGLIPDGKKFSDIKSLKTKKQESKQNEDKPNFLKWNSPSEKKKYELIKAKAQVKQMAKQPQNTNQMQNSNAKVLKKTNNTSTGFANALLLTLITGFAGGIIATIMYFIINK